MKKALPLYMYGLIIILAGVFLFLSHDISFPTIKLTLGIGMALGAVLAFLTAWSRKERQVQAAYHAMHAFAMLVFAVSEMLFCQTIGSLLFFTAFLLFFYAFSEMIFCLWLFNLRQRVNYGILFLRLFLGLFTGIATILLMRYEETNIPLMLGGFGVLFAIIGVNVLMYVPVLKSNERSEAEIAVDKMA